MLRARSGSRSTRRRPKAQQIHGALLSGLLSHLGVKDAADARVHRRARGEVCDLPRLGARATRAVVGDGRRAGRDDAAVGEDRSRGRVKQVEPLAEHLVKRSYGEPRWDRGAAPSSRPSR